MRAAVLLEDRNLVVKEAAASIIRSRCCRIKVLAVQLLPYAEAVVSGKAASSYELDSKHTNGMSEKLSIDWSPIEVSLKSPACPGILDGRSIFRVCRQARVPSCQAACHPRSGCIGSGPRSRRGRQGRTEG